MTSTTHETDVLYSTLSGDPDLNDIVEMFVAEMPESRRPDETEGWALLRDRVYGHTRLAIYRMTSAAAAG